MVVPIGAASPARAAVAGPGIGGTGIDGRGVTRPQGAQCDIGAYEYQQPSDDYVFGNGVD